MELQQASRKKAKIKMALQSPSGAGKTMSALFIAYGLCGSWEKIAVIDSENRSADLYAELGSYYVLPLTPPFSPERYIQAIDTCIKAGMEVLIIDSISHEWEGIGGILDIHASMIGNSFTNWSKLTPRHDAFIQTMLQANLHVIATIRSKQEYVLSEKNGKQVPEKVGMKGITRDNIEYEFTIAFELDMSHKAKVLKDRTQLFTGKPEFIPTIETGKNLLDWCNKGIDTPDANAEKAVRDKIAASTTISQLTTLYETNQQFHQTLLSEFTKRRQEITRTNSNPTIKGS